MKETRRTALLFSTALCTGIVAAWLGASAAQAGPAPVQNYGVRVPARHGAVTVRPGDTLSRIAGLYRLRVEDLAAVNGLRPPYTISVGQRLSLPPPRDYTVRAGDTLYGIARMHGVPAASIAQSNGLRSPYALKTGQVLRLPFGASAAAPKVAAAPSVSKRSLPAGAKTAVLLKEPGQGQGAFATLLNRFTSKETAEEKPKTSLVAAATAVPRVAPPEIVDRSSRAGFIWPVRGQIISSYGPKSGGLYNDGINIAAPRGTPVKAASGGTVAYVGDQLSSYGNLVLLRHAGGMVTAYAHLNTVSVKVGDRVSQGQTIGSVGSTGTVYNAQLHFEVRQGKKTLDPKKYLG